MTAYTVLIGTHRNPHGALAIFSMCLHNPKNTPKISEKMMKSPWDRDTHTDMIGINTGTIHASSESIAMTTDTVLALHNDHRSPCTSIFSMCCINSWNTMHSFPLTSLQEGIEMRLLVIGVLLSQKPAIQFCNK